MKDNRNVRDYRATGSRWVPVAIILAAVLSVHFLTFGSRIVFAADPVDVSKACSLKVFPGTIEGIEDANVVIDLYRIADAKKVEGQDTFEWEMNSGFESVTANGNDSAGWKAAAQAAAAVVLGTPEGETEWNPSDYSTVKPVPVTSVNANETASGLQAGLYLLIARGEGVDKYAGYEKTEAESGHGGLITMANSAGYTYLFYPELISLPTKSADSTVPSNTSDLTDWIYDAQATLKPLKEARLGSIEIVKNLLTFEDHDPATFVFEVTATTQDGEATKVVYNDVVSITFDGAGQKKTLIENKIPVGAVVTVTEVYPKQGKYFLTGTDTPEAPVVEAESIISFGFTNDYNNEDGGGGSVTNRFEYASSHTDTQKGSGSGWEFAEQTYDDQASSAEGN